MIIINSVDLIGRATRGGSKNGKYVFIVMNDNHGDLRDQIEFICEDVESADKICFYLNLQVDYRKYDIIQWEVEKTIIDNN